jgi:Methyltransferase domain
MSGLGKPWEELRREALASPEGWTYLQRVDLAPPVPRIEYLEQLCAGKRIVHVGCSSEGGAAKQQERGEFLFGRLDRVAEAQLGVDPYAEGNALLRERHAPRQPILDCRLEDIDDRTLVEFNADLILIPEVVEHVPDAGTLLQTAARAARLAPHTKVVITVPGPWSHQGLDAWSKGMELCHPDHVAFYTPRTLQTLLEKSGLEPLEIRPYLYPSNLRPYNDRGLLSVFLRGGGSFRERVRRTFIAGGIGAWGDGWIATAR